MLEEGRERRGVEGNVRGVEEGGERVAIEKRQVGGRRK
jgi:hypothetical protein